MGNTYINHIAKNAPQHRGIRGTVKRLLLGLSLPSMSQMQPRYWRACFTAVREMIRLYHINREIRAEEQRNATNSLLPDDIMRRYRKIEASDD